MHDILYLSVPSLFSIKMDRCALFIFILTFLKVNTSGVEDGIMKYTKVLCSSSGKSMEKLYCRVKPISRSETYLNFGGNLIKPLKNVFADFLLWHRPLIGGNFNRLLKVDNLNACDLIKSAVNNIIFRYFLEFANGTVLKGLIREVHIQLDSTKSKTQRWTSM